MLLKNKKVTTSLMTNQPKSNKKEMIFLMMISQPKKCSQSLSHNLKRRNKSLQNPFWFLMLRFMTQRPTLMNFLREFQLQKLKVWFGTTSQKNYKLLLEFSNCKWDALLKMQKFSQMIFSKKFKSGKKFNQLIWSACKNYDYASS